MNKAESDRIDELCSQIALEHDHRKLLELVEELNRVLSTRQKTSHIETPEREKKT